MSNAYYQPEANFPNGKIGLLDGRVVNCYPLAVAEIMTPSPFDKEAEKDLFIKNAFYFLAHKERILTDSRMFLCPVPIQSGMSISGTSGFQRPTLGVYLQWWDTCAGAMRTDKKGRRSLVYHLAGSNLSGSNHCAEVYDDGTTKSVTLLPFKDHYLPFIHINQLYTEAKQKYQYYTLQQVLDILDHEDEGDKEYAHSLNEQILCRAVALLNEQIHSLNSQNKALQERCSQTLLQLKEEKILRYYEGYKALEQQVASEVNTLKQKKRDLKTALRRGDYDQVQYERLVVRLNQIIKDEEQRLSHYQLVEIQKVFPDQALTFYQVEDYVSKLKGNPTT